ncbi:putative bifunctional diguanylate cyclase/phosphodiesterase [Niveibacterium sp.]|uniref:putative bifunctional diguanylate cyclase/phosphodiesterase n=1 Tax=Niveibacterium sp. TaxID=2017444 RepID=UPI0035B3B9BB
MTPVIASARVLVVDDDLTTRSIAMAALKDAGFEPFEACDGVEALERFTELQPELILLDLMMPRLDGFETARRLRRTPGGERVPVIVMTGLEDSGAIEQAYQAGATDFISKPINWMLLRHRILYVLRSARAMDELAKSESNLADAQRIARLGSWEWHLREGYVRRSEQFFALFGDDPVAFPPAMDAVLERVYPQDRTIVREAYSQGKRGQPFRIEYRIVRHDGALRTVLEQAEPIASSDGAVTRLQGTTQDITEQVEAEKRIRYLAYYDSLTGLPNRQYCRELLKQTLRRATRARHWVAAMVVDVDRFGRINESLGQSVGDQVLQVVARRLSEAVAALPGREDSRSTAAVVARIGGDQFVVFIDGAPAGESPEAISARLLDAVRKPILLSATEVALTASIGLAVFPEHADDADALLKCADMAVSLAKRENRDAVRSFSQDLRVAAELRLALENEMRKALEQGEFELHFQPVISWPEGSVLAAEALIRWRHPKRGLLAPGEFIPLAEETGLIVEIGEWGLQAACKQMAAWVAQGVAPRAVAVNLSGISFRHVRLLSAVSSALAAAGLPANRLELEMTESVLMRDVELTYEILAELKRMGVRLMVDDFGTGYSSLAYLKRFPIDVLKIDRSFVKDLDRDSSDAAITSAVMAMSQELGLAVVAEGVETEAQAAALARRGCKAMQGFLFARPLPAAEFIEWTKRGWPRAMKSA